MEAVRSGQREAGKPEEQIGILQVVRCAQCERLAPVSTAILIRLMEVHPTLVGGEVLPAGDIYTCEACGSELRRLAVPPRV